MERNEVHAQINRICEKIVFLNNTIQEDKSIHTAELELLSNYLATLSQLIEKLSNTNLSANIPNDLPVDTETNTDEKTEVKPESSISEEEKAEKIEREINNVAEKIDLDIIPPEDVPVELPFELAPDLVVDDTKNEIEEKEVEEITEQTIEDIEQVIREEEQSSINDQFKNRPSDLASKLQGKPIEDLRQHLDLSQKYEFISQLFNGDVDYFNTALKRLNDADNFEDALNYINTELKKRFDWDDKTVYEKKLTVILEKKFGVSAVN